jgi:nucleotide-binding universal stress UspA family protein
VARRRRALLALAGHEDLDIVTSTIGWLLEPSAQVVVWHGTQDPDAETTGQRMLEVLAAVRRSGYRTQGWLGREILGVPDDMKYAAEGFSADLLACGTRGMSELSAFLRGSVSRQVAHLTDLPLLIIPPR